MVELNPAGVNHELKQSRRWVLWSLCDVADGDKLRKDCKPPYQASGRPAKHNDPSTWSTYEAALAAHQANVPFQHPSNIVKDHGVRGIGTVIGAPFIGIDIDDCRNSETGELTPDARAWVEELRTYTEVSPSGTGLHLWLHGEPPYKEGHRKDGREIYSTNRYLTVTGVTIGDTTDIRRFSKEEIAALYARVKAGRSVAKSAPVDEGSYTSAKIADMMNRIDFPDLSQAVQSLLTKIAIEEHCDRERVETRFKQSKLYTETHWNEKWERLRESELGKAVAHAQEHLAKRFGDEGERRIEFIDDDQVIEKPLLYLWDPMLPMGKLVHFAGRSSEGKSPVTSDLMARLSRGWDFPENAPNGYGEPRRSILLNMEDGMADMIVPRYRLAGGIPGWLRIVRGMKIDKNGSSHDALVALDKDIRHLCELARRTEKLGLIVIDPITNYLGGKNMNAEDDVRSILTPLAGIAEELNIVVITVGHLNKNADNSDPWSRVMGAAAFAGVARALCMFGEDKERPDNKYAHVMSEARSRGSSYCYETVAVDRDFDGVKSRVIKVEWKGKSEATAEDAAHHESKKSLSKEKEAGVELRSFLKGGARPKSDCFRYMRSVNYDLEKLNDTRVRKHGKIASFQKDGKTYWALKNSDDLFQKSTARSENDGPEY